MKTLFFVVWLFFAASMLALSLIPHAMTTPNYSDKMMHISVFCLLMLYPMCAWTQWKRIALFALFLGASTVAAEFAQELVPGRESSVTDAAAGCAGILVGCVIGWLLRSGYHASVPVRLMLWVCAILLIPASLAPAAAAEIPGGYFTDPESWRNPDYAPLGVRYGTFVGYGGLAASEIYDDNIFRTQSKISDLITTIQPALLVKSDWNLHKINMGAMGNFGLHRDQTDEDYSDYNVFTSGQYDIAYETFLSALLSYSHQHEDRGSPEDTDGDKPLVFNTARYGMGFTRKLGYIHAQVDAQRDQIRFESSSLNGAPIDNDFRNRNENSLHARIAYAFIPGYELFTSATFRKNDYLLEGPLDRSSTGYDVDAGIAIDLTGKLLADIYGGYLYRDYKANFENASDSFFGASLEWQATPLTSIRIATNKIIYETTVSGSSGSIRSRHRLDVKHSPLYNLDLTGALGWDEYEYLGATPQRTDKLYRAEAGADYKIGRGFSVGVAYNYRKRDSDIDAHVYDDNRAMISFKYAH